MMAKEVGKPMTRLASIATATKRPITTMVMPSVSNPPDGFIHIQTNAAG